MSDELATERVPDEVQVITRALDLRLARTYVMRPGRIEKFDATNQLADVKPLLMNDYVDKAGERQTVSVPVIPNVPVAFMGGATGLDTYPVAKGDECMLLFADRSLDRWIEYGDEQDPGRAPHHDVTDAIALVGIRSKPKKLTEFDQNRKVLGLKVGSPRIALGENNIDLGVNHNENASDNVALASLVKNELNALKTALQNFVTTYNTHTHPVTTAGTATAQSGNTTPPTSPATPPNTVQDVKSTIVRCK